MWSKKPILCVSTGVVYPSIAEAASEAGVNKSTMSRHIKQLTKHVKGRIYIEYDKPEPPTPEELKMIQTAELNRRYGMYVAG